jgi:creatinine amidohydrolase
MPGGSLRFEDLNWMEAFLFTRVSDLPDGVKPTPAAPALIGAHETREIYGNGSFGGPDQAPTEVMSELFNAALEDVIRPLNFQRP